jgi:hypothetical protein
MLERHRRNSDVWLKNVRNYHAPRMCPVYFDYVENRGMNAFAFEFENYGFVGVYVGAVVTIYSLFGYLLSHPGFLTTIGHPSEEEEWTAFDPKHLTRRPKDPLRASFAHLLATFAIDFLFAHEIGHLMNGHVRFLRLKSGAPMFSEFDAMQGSELGNLTSQTLEMDADSFATGQGLAGVFGRASDPNAIFPKEFRPWFSTPKSALFAWMLAIYGFFRLFFGGETKFDDLLLTPHPPPTIRLNMTLGTLVEFLRKRGIEELIPQLNPMFAEIVPTIERAHALITSTPVDDTGIRAAFDPRAAEHIRVLLAHWKTLRPHLVPLVLGGNLAE